MSDARPQVRYERRGTGEPLVLLHGIGHNWQAWSPVLDRLAVAHDVIAIDLPGFGATPAPRHPVRSLSDLVDAVRGIIDGLDLGRPHVAGNSLGGALALELACAGAVASATALSPIGFWTAGQARQSLAVLHALRRAAMVPEPALRLLLNQPRLRALAYRILLARPERLSLDAALNSARTLRAAPAFASVARAGRRYVFRGTPEVPVTVAWGRLDRLLPYRQSALARQRLPRANHVALPGCGHLPMSDDPELVTRVILEATAAASTAGAREPAAEAGHFNGATGAGVPAPAAEAGHPADPATPSGADGAGQAG